MRKLSYVDFLVSKTKQRLILLFLLLIPIAAFSQKGTFRTLMQVQGSALSKQFKPYELCCDLGYNITDNLYADLRYENAIALFKENGVKDYAHSHIVGLNLGYIVYHTENCNIGAQIGYGSNMKRKNSDWKYDYYEAMAFTDLGTCKIKPRFGLGVRHYNSRTKLYKDRTIVFASIGFGINW